MARFKLGMFDPEEDVPYAQIPFSVNTSKEHAELALEAARKAFVSENIRFAFNSYDLSSVLPIFNPQLLC